MTDHYDVIVIGSGAGGGTLTHAPAPTGKRILLLEGETLRVSRRTGTPSRSGWTCATTTQGTGPTSARTRSSCKQNYYVGGNTKVYGAILFRFRERDFRQIQHVDGISPAGRDADFTVVQPGAAPVPRRRPARRRPRRAADGSGRNQ